MNVLEDYLFLSHKEWFMSFAGLDAESLSVYLRIFFRKMGNDTGSFKCLSSFED